MKLTLQNSYIMVRVEENKKEETTTASGIIIPEEKMEEDQVAKGVVVEVSKELEDKYKKGDGIFFQKFNPTDVHMKYDSDKLEEFWFIKNTDVICTYNI